MNSIFVAALALSVFAYVSSFDLEKWGQITDTPSGYKIVAASAITDEPLTKIFTYPEVIA